MAWEPQINVFDERSIKDNLIAFFAANQADALAWANGGAALPNIAAFHRSVRLVTVFPALTILQTRHRSSYEDALEVELSMVFQVAIVHGKQDMLAARSTRYAMALESMLCNIPKTTFNSNSILIVNAEDVAMETVFDVQAKFRNQFIQVFETSVDWVLTGQARG